MKRITTQYFHSGVERLEEIFGLQLQFARWIVKLRFDPKLKSGVFGREWSTQFFGQSVYNRDRNSRHVLFLS